MLLLYLLTEGLEEGEIHLHFATLASGSSGNAILVGEGKRSLLVDSGISMKSLLHNLELLKVAPAEIEGIIVTHEHNDHIKGVGALARKLKIPVYTSPAIWQEMEQPAGKLADNQRVAVNTKFNCAGLAIEMFATSHDSRESYGLRIERRRPDQKLLALGIATDSGTITEAMHRSLKGCDALIVEANHDEDRLWHGSYPWYLKKRISGVFGHLANRQLAEGLLEWIEDNTQRVVLAHLSEENNTPELALATVVQALRTSRSIRKNKDLRLRVAPRYIPHELILLREN